MKSVPKKKFFFFKLTTGYTMDGCLKKVISLKMPYKESVKIQHFSLSKNYHKKQKQNKKTWEKIRKNVKNAGRQARNRETMH